MQKPEETKTRAIALAKRGQDLAGRIDGLRDEYHEKGAAGDIQFCGALEWIVDIPHPSLWPMRLVDHMICDLSVVSSAKLSTIGYAGQAEFTDVGPYLRVDAFSEWDSAGMLTKMGVEDWGEDGFCFSYSWNSPRAPSKTHSLSNKGRWMDDGRFFLEYITDGRDDPSSELDYLDAILTIGERAIDLNNPDRASYEKAWRAGHKIKG